MTHNISRRNFLKGMGVTSVVVAGGLVWRAADSGVFSTGQGAAYEPWTNWRSEQTRPLNLVRAAILASNPHNVQSWRFRVAERQIDLFIDLQRNIGTIDPLQREITIGVGAALANLLLAAQAEGYRPTLTLLPDQADSALMARVSLEPSVAEASALYAAIPHRHTNRGEFDQTRPVSSQQLNGLSSLALDLDDVKLVWLTEPRTVQTFREETLAATQAIIADARQSADSFAWQRTGWQELQEKRDGLTYDAQGMGLLLTTLVKMLPVLSQAQADQGWFEAMRDRQLATTSTVGIIVARDMLDTRQRLTAGRLWQRLHLQMTVEGLSAQPLNQLLERRDREIQLGSEQRFGRTIAELVGDDHWSALLPFRVGYPTAAALPSPRRDVQAVLVPPG